VHFQAVISCILFKWPTLHNQTYHVKRLTTKPSRPQNVL